MQEMDPEVKPQQPTLAPGMGARAQASRNRGAPTWRWLIESRKRWKSPSWINRQTPGDRAIGKGRGQDSTGRG